MNKGILGTALAVLILALLGAAAPARAADNYDVDPAHTAVIFKISHIGLSYVYGRFNDFSGNFTIDTADAGKSAFALNVKTESVDTANKQRDDHLRSPDFFNAKQFPAITFKSTAVKPVEGGLEVTGDFTLHGVTKSITVPLKGGKTAEFPKGTQRTGYSGEATLKRADFGIDKFAGAVGDDVLISISFEGVKK